MVKVCQWAIAATLALIVTLDAAQAATRTYFVDRTIGAGSVTGFIHTDGTLGALSAGSILDFSLSLTSSQTLSNRPDTTDVVTAANGAVSGIGNLTASATDIQFDFSGLAVTFFQSGLTGNGWCLSANFGCNPGAPATAETIFFDGNSQVADFVDRAGTGALTIAAVPLPASLSLLFLAVGGLCGMRALRCDRYT